jgi:hypothetical protein
MDFIEQWFHMSPDNGSGALEIMYVVAVALLVVVLSCRRGIAVHRSRVSFSPRLTFSSFQHGRDLWTPHLMPGDSRKYTEQEQP